MSDITSADINWLDSAARFAALHTGPGQGGAAAALVVDEAEEIVLGRGAIGAPDGDFEIRALAEAGAAARGATLYATVPPRPYPVIDAGIARVVVGAADPWAGTHEARMSAFEEAGVPALVADGHAPSLRLVEAAERRANRNRPFVTIRLAVSRDGMVARRDGRHIELMGKEARRWALMQRALHDAVLVGARTAGLDEAYLDEGLEGLEDRRYGRIVVIGAVTLPPRYFLERSAALRHTYAVVLEGRGPALPGEVQVVSVPGRGGRPDLRRMLSTPLWAGILGILVEPGARLLESMLSTEMVDRLHLVDCISEIGTAGLPVTALGGLEGRLRAAGLVEVRSRPLGADRLRTFEPRR